MKSPEIISKEEWFRLASHIVNLGLDTTRTSVCSKVSCHTCPFHQKECEYTARPGSHYQRSTRKLYYEQAAIMENIRKNIELIEKL